MFYSQGIREEQHPDGLEQHCTPMGGKCMTFPHIETAHWASSLSLAGARWNFLSWLTATTTTGLLSLSPGGSDDHRNPAIKAGALWNMCLFVS